MLLVPIFQPEEFNGKLYTEYGYVLKQFAKYMTEIERLQVDLEKTHNQLVEVEKESQERIAELESELEAKDVNDRTVELPFDALETANMLINATHMRKAKGFDRLHCCDGYTLETDMYSVDDLEQIAEHLLVYCKHNKEDEE